MTSERVQCCQECQVTIGLEEQESVMVSAIGVCVSTVKMVGLLFFFGGGKGEIWPKMGNRRDKATEVLPGYLAVPWWPWQFAVEVKLILCTWVQNGS